MGKLAARKSMQISNDFLSTVTRPVVGTVACATLADNREPPPMVAAELTWPDLDFDSLYGIGIR
jgi:hypothetical protein